jgi:diguanylate cyclase (GGDEF)-like protein
MASRTRDTGGGRNVATLAPSAAARLHRRHVATGFNVGVVILVVGLLLSQLGSLRSEAGDSTLWIMTVLAAFAGTQAFISTTPSAGVVPVIVCPTICFTFAIVLCWGLGPAIISQAIAVVVVAWRLHRPVREGIAALGQYTLSFVAAEAVLALGNPDPLHHHDAARVASDALTVVGAVVAWLITYGLLAILLARLMRTGPRAMPARDVISHQVLFKAALLLLSPLLAISAHMNIGFVPLIFIPLYAVQRMAKLSAQRDRAVRLDPLSGLANRAGLKAAFHDIDADGESGTLALLLADLDEFKHVNDALGHEVGDQLLVAVGQRLARLPIHGGTIARLGGDEFALLTTVRAATEANDLAAEVVAALSEPLSLGGLRVDISASIGVAIRIDADEDFATMMRHADIAMYDAKQSGGAVAAYQPGSHQDSLARLALLTDFRRALECDDSQISLHYQPQVCLATGHVEGVEALLRWQHPDLGAINTQDLIAMAEHSSVMHLLTTRVIDDVVAQLGTWSAEGLRLRASINVSARDLYGDDIVPRLQARMAQHGVDPSQIQIEITEGALMGDPSRAMGTVNRIHSLGVAVALDDFGTGYSSLQHLRKMPISEIKIDRSFVAGMASNHDDAAIVRSTVEMARSLGIRTVAEGVETEYTRQLLTEAGCTLVQGWLTAHPMPADEISRWLTTKQIATIG